MNPTAQTQSSTPQTQAPRPDGAHSRGFVTPPANISPTDNGYMVEVDMPGVDKAGLEVTIEGNELTIIGRRHSELPEDELCYCESPRADYRRTFELGPDVDTAHIGAEMQQGVLKLRLPKSAQAKPRHIEVKVA